MSQRYESAEPVRGASRAPYVIAPLVGLLVTLLSWRYASETPEAGLDSSWQASLAMAAHSSLEWGSQLVFTYGPLGWIRETRDWYTDTGGWAMAYLAVTRVALAASLWLIVRRHLGSVIAAVLLLPILWVVDDETTALGFVGAVTLVVASLDTRRETLLAVALGAFGGFAMLGKINAGVTVLVIGGIAAVLAGGGRAATVRRAAWWAGSAAATFLVLWVITGQSLGAIPDYAHNSLRVISGYSQAMSAEYASSNNYWLAGLVTVAGVYGIWNLLDTRATHERGVLLLIWLAWCAFQFKAAFVRHDDGHAFLFFAAAAPALAALPLRRGCRVAPATIALLLVAPLCFKWSTGVTVSEVISPRTSLEAGKDQISRIWNTSERAAIRDEGRRATIAAKPLAPEMLQAIGRSTVAVQPSESSAVWAYRLRWSPLPVFQDYQAYTQGLDLLNAEKLLSPSAPEKILYRPDEPVDGRFPAWDTPATYRARACRYQPVMAANQWLLFKRGEYRCSAPKLVSTVQAAWGQLVSVPQPSTPESLVFVRIAGAGVAGVERLRTMAYKSYDRSITLEPGTRTTRVIPGTLGGGLPIAAGKNADLPVPYNVAPGAEHLSLARDGDPGTDAELRFDFYETKINGGIRDVREVRP